jgi:hypothetical protein
MVAVQGDTLTTHEGGRTEDARKGNLLEAIAKQAEDDPTQFHRVPFALQNMLDVSKTLQPGYQIKTTIGTCLLLYSSVIRAE